MSTRPSEQRWAIQAPEDLGRAIAGVRTERGLTQAELSEQIGVGRSYLAELEAGGSALIVERALRALRRMGATVTVTIETDRDDARAD